MTQFRISGRIERLGPARFASTVTAHPAHGAESGQGHSLSETSTSDATALDALRRLGGELAERIRARGDEVLALEFDPN